jgi:hypothetical protein
MRSRPTESDLLWEGKRHGTLFDDAIGDFDALKEPRIVNLHCFLFPWPYHDRAVKKDANDLMKRDFRFG